METKTRFYPDQESFIPGNQDYGSNFNAISNQIFDVLICLLLYIYFGM